MRRRLLPNSCPLSPAVLMLVVLLLVLISLWSATPVAAADPCVPGPHSGNIASSQRWCLADSPHLVTGGIYVNNGATLTIEAGVIVQFNNGLFMEVQSGGTLIVAGTAGQPVSLQSSAAVPTKGIWRFVRALSGSHLQADYMTISHAGGVDGYALNIATSDAAVRQSRILYSLTAGIHVVGSGTAPVVENTEVAYGDGSALSQSVVDALPAYSGMSLHDNGVNARVIPYGSLGRHVTWDASPEALGGAPIHLGGVIVPSPWALTITAGSTLRFAAATYIQVQTGGSLYAAGTAEAPITLEPQGTPSAGAWRGLEFLTGASGDSIGQLTHCDIGYAGGVTGRTVYIRSSGVSLSDVHIHDGNGYGVFIEGEGLAPSLVRMEISACSGVALSQNYLNTQPVLSGLDLHGNGTDAWVVAGGTLNRDLTLDGSAAVLGGAPVHLGYAVVDTGYTLTVTPGTTLLLPVGGYIQVRTGGTLHAVGTSTARVTFAGQATGAGAWRRLEFQTGSIGQLEYCDVAQGGAALNQSISIASNAVQLRHSRIRDGLGTGIWLQGTGIAPVLEHIEVDHNSGKAVHQALFNMSPIYVDLNLHDNGSDSVTIDGVASLTSPVTLDSVGLLNGAPYDFPQGCTISAGGVLQISAGTEIHMSGSIQVREGGQLWAPGTEESPVTFTSLSEAPEPGQWGSIWYQARGVGAMTYCDVGFGGSGWAGYAVRIDDPNVRLERCNIHHSQGTGLVVWLFAPGDGPVVAFNTIAHNGTQGIHINEIHPTSVFMHNAVYDNGGYALYNNDSGSDVVDARNHYWGHPSGPYHPTRNPGGVGGQVTDYVSFYPWVTQPGDLSSTVAPELLAPAPAETVTDLPFTFQLVSADPDSWQRLTYTVEISRAGVLQGVYDGFEDPARWDRLSYAPGETATLTLLDVLPNGDYTWRGGVSDGWETAWSEPRSFSVAWAGTLAVTGLEQDGVLALRDAPVPIVIRGGGFAAGLSAVSVQRLLWDGSVETVPVTEYDVISSSAISATLDLAGASGPWQVQVSQGGLAASAPLYVWPWLPLFSVDYINPLLTEPGRAAEHTLIVRNGGTADGVAIVSIWAPRWARLGPITVAEVEYLGSTADRTHLLAVTVPAGGERLVPLIWTIPSDVVNWPGYPANPTYYNLHDPLRWRFAGIGQVPVSVWGTIKAQAPADVEQQSYLALWAGALIEGHAADQYLELGDGPMAGEYIERLGEVYPWIANVLVTRQILDFERAMYSALDMEVPGVAAWAVSEEAGAAGWLTDIIHRLIGDPWEFSKQMHMWMYDLLVQDTYGTDPLGQTTGFLIAQGEGMLNGYTWGLWEPTLGSAIYQHVYGLDPGTVSIGHAIGQWLSIPLTWGGRIPITGVNKGLRLTNPVVTPTGAAWSTIQDAAIGKVVEPYRWDHSWSAPGETGTVLQWSQDAGGSATLGAANTSQLDPYYYSAPEGLSALAESESHYVPGDPIYTAHDALPRNQNGTPWLHVNDLSELQASITISETPADEWARQETETGETPLPPPPAQTRAACTYGSSELVVAWDPNSIEGAPHVSHILPTQALEYTVRFENLPEASAAAWTVTVTLPIDPNLDWDSLELLGTSRPDLARPRADKATRTISWAFEGIDLPPNVTPPEGEGWVRFRASPAAGLVTGDQIEEQAGIYFDYNPVVETNVHVYTIDLAPPTATVAVDDVMPGQALVTASATDNTGGSGVANIAVQVSVDGLDWMTAGVLMVDPSVESASGQLGLRLVGGHYLIRAVATDAVANVGLPSAPLEIDVPAGFRVYLPLVFRQIRWQASRRRALAHSTG